MVLAVVERGVAYDDEAVIETRELGRVLRARRMVLGLTQGDVADRLHVDQKTYSDMELGRKRRPLAPDMVRRLREALGFSEYELVRAMGYLADESGPPPARIGREQVFTAMMQQAGEAEGLGERERQVIVEAIRLAERMSRIITEDSAQ